MAIGRYAYFGVAPFKDVSVLGEYALLTNPSSLVNTLSLSYFKNSDYYPDVLTYNYTDIEFRNEPDKLSIDEIVLNLLYMVPYTTYVANQRTIDSSVGSISTKVTQIYDKEDLLLDINNIPHKDLLFDLSDTGVEYLLLPESSDWNLMLSYMKDKRRNVV